MVRKVLGIYITIILSLYLLAPIPIQAQTKPRANFNIFLGQKSLNKSNWDTLTPQLEYGLESDFTGEGWPIAFVCSWYKAVATGNDMEIIQGTPVKINWEGSTQEAGLGVKKIWDQNLQGYDIHPFISGGVCYIFSEAAANIPAAGGIRDSDLDAKLGFWTGTGVYVTLWEHYNIGVTVRYSDAEAEMFEEKGKAGGLHYGGFMGFGY